MNENAVLTSKKILHGELFEPSPGNEVLKSKRDDVPSETNEDDYGSSADTETEMPLSQDGFDLLRSLKPLSSDELYSVVKTESEDDVCEASTPPPASSLSQRIRIENIMSLKDNPSDNGLVQNVNSCPCENLGVKGKYIFTLQFESEGTPAKSCKYTYSAILQKLFAQMDKFVPVSFKFDLPVPGSDTEIRSYLIYKEMDSRELNVDRCPHHLNLNINERYPHHIIDSLGNEHLVCPFSKRYVTVLKPGITNKNRNMDSFSSKIRFRCMSSCRGGIDRRTLLVVYELYVANKFCGRAVLEVVICTSPGRDRVNQERKYLLKTTNGVDSPFLTAPSYTQSSSIARPEHSNGNSNNMIVNGDRSSPYVVEHCTNEMNPSSSKRPYVTNGSNTQSTKRPFESCDDCIYGSVEQDEYFIKVKGFHNAILLKGMAERLSQLEDLKREKSDYEKR